MSIETMAAKSEGRETLHSAFREKLKDIPDPLHFELPHGHKKVLEAAYVIIILAAIVSILIYGTLVGWPSTVVNASSMLIMALGFILAFIVFEHVSVSHSAKKSSS
jgi:hypothetical protein